MNTSPLTWIITEGLAGTENQCLGVAEALGVQPITKRIQLNQPWKLLSPYIGCESAATFSGDPLQAPWPDLLIASGRKSIAAVRYIKKNNPQTFCVQIQDPRINSSCFDLLAVPEHDPTRGHNVVVTRATPNRLSQQILDQAKKDFAESLANLPSPRVAVLIGGSTKSHELDIDQTHNICETLLPLIRHRSGLMITTSRRTGDGPTRIIRTQLQAPTSLIWDGKSPNPYFGYLAWADFIIVTSDSISMISEAASTGKPVYVIKLKGGSPRLNQALDGLVRGGFVRIFEGILEPYTYPPLQDARLVADEIRRKSGLFQQ